LTTLFVSGSRAELDQSNRFQAQQNARLALDKLRREIHCASEIKRNSGNSITIKLGAYCPTNSFKDPPVGATTDPTTRATSFTWCVKNFNGTTPPAAGGGPYTLWRYADSNGCTGAGREWADHLYSAVSSTAPPDVFPFCTPENPLTRERATVQVDVLVDVSPKDRNQQYRLTDDIVLRNTSRSFAVSPC